MGRRRLTGWLMAVAAVLFICSVLFFLLHEDDAYRHYTGLGSTLALSPDDSTYAFTYFEDGREAIYTANRKGGQVRKIRGETEMTEPAFAPDGKGLLYLGRDENGRQSIYFKDDIDSGDARLLTKRYLDVLTAAFSPDGGQVYFVASPVDDGSLPKDITEGTNLYTVGIDGNSLARLTKDGIVPMSRLAVTPDGGQIQYVGFGEEERLYVYDIEKKTHEPAAAEFSTVPYDPAFSPDGRKIAYTSVAKTEDDEGLFEYEVFTAGADGANARQLTYNEKHASVPVFSRDGNSIAYLQQTNWPDDPADFQLRTVHLEQGKDELIHLEMPPLDEALHLDEIANRIVTVPFAAFLYALFFVCWTVRAFGGTGTVFKRAAIGTVLIAATLGVIAFLLWKDPILAVDFKALLYAGAAAAAAIIVSAAVLHIAGRKRGGGLETRRNSAI